MDGGWRLYVQIPPIESLDAIDSEVLKSIRALGCAETDEALLAELQSPEYAEPSEHRPTDRRLLGVTHMCTIPCS